MPKVRHYRAHESEFSFEKSFVYGPRVSDDHSGVSRERRHLSGNETLG